MLNENAIANAFAVTVPPFVAAPRTCDYCSKPLTAAEYQAHLEAGETTEWMCDACAEGTEPQPVSPHVEPQPTQPQNSLPQETDAAKLLAAKRNAKVDAIVRALKPAPDNDYAKKRVAKGLPVGTMAVKVHSYFLDLYRAAHPKATREQAATEVNSLIAGALEAGVIWASVGGFNANTRGSLKWYYSSTEYPKPVSKAVLAIEKAKAEAAELGW